MAEAYHFNDCLVKTVSGTDETRIDTYAENVTVSYKRSFFEVKDEDGQIVKRYESGRAATMDIGVLHSADIAHTDGNSIKVYGTDQGTQTTWLLGSAYIQDKGWNQNQNDSVRHDVKIVARTYGTTS